MQISLTKKSANSKTGKIPVSTTSEDTCPRSCPFYERGCYANLGPLRLHWEKVSNGDRGQCFGAFLKELRTLPAGTLWRHNQAGDLPGKGEKINKRLLRRLANASKGLRGFTYTHKPIDGDSYTACKNREAIQEVNCKDFTINLSANSIKHADSLVKLQIAPVTTVLRSSENRKSFLSPDGNRITVCPAMVHDHITCKSCKLCAISDRGAIIGFPAHSSRKRLIDEMLTISNNF